MRLTRLLFTGSTIVLALWITAVPADAQQLFPVAPVAAPARAAQPLFAAAPQQAAQQPATPTTSTNTNDRRFGAGLRFGGVTAAVGGTARYFFYGGPLGVQAQVAWSGITLGDLEWSGIQFQPSAIYRFVDQKLNGPTLIPYAGGGLNFVHSFIDEEDEPFFEPLDLDDTTVGVLLFGGVELFFERLPNLGVSGELSFVSNDDVRTTSMRGVAFAAAAHWYFW
ncbi:MAG TPA: hypothetical protein VFV95_02075 [Vicinamibacterales bacterium]|nr:hypothetical protein [Vicinamibacterales bacterium]